MALERTRHFGNTSETSELGMATFDFSGYQIAAKTRMF